MTIKKTVNHKKLERLTIDYMKIRHEDNLEAKNILNQVRELIKNKKNSLTDTDFNQLVEVLLKKNEDLELAHNLH